MNIHNSIIRKILVLCLSIALIVPCLPVEATIFWTDYVTITQTQQVVDSITIDGKTVNAVYAPKGSFQNDDTEYSCAAFVKRFYMDVFGIDVYGLKADGSKYTPQGGDFSETENPVIGDIAANGSHWAIVKSVDGNKITLIEQNCWGIEDHANDACIHRVLETESSYWFFHYAGNMLAGQGEDSGNNSSGDDVNIGGSFGDNDTQNTPSDSIVVHNRDDLKNALIAGGYIVVDDDIRFQATQDGFYPTVKQPVILDLNGHTVDFDSQTLVYSDLRIVGNGKIAAQSFFVYNSSFVVDNGTISIWELDLDSDSTIIINDGSFTEGRMWVNGNIQINGGKFQDHSIRLFEGAHGEMTNGLLCANLKSCLYIEEGSRFEMNGGEICGNGVENPYFNCVENEGEFYLNGGSIHDDKYGISDKGRFVMSDGEIYNCVYGINAGEDFTMSGGKIHDNRVGIYNAGKGITIEGGKIYNNQSGIDAWNADGTLTILAGEIYSNVSYGIRICTDIVMSGGKIYQNGGCGVILSGGTMYLSGSPVIKDNRSDTGDSANLVTYSMMDTGNYWGELCNIVISDSLSNGCNISIYSVDGIEGIFTTGYSSHNGTTNPNTYFCCDSEDYEIDLDTSGEVRLNYIHSENNDQNDDDEDDQDIDESEQNSNDQDTIDPNEETSEKSKDEDEPSDFNNDGDDINNEPSEEKDTNVPSEDSSNDTSSVVTNTVEDVINEAVSKTDKSIIIEAYSTTSQKGTLASQIQKSSTLQKQIGVLEDAYANEHSIIILDPISDVPFIDEDEVKVIGAGLSADDGSTIQVIIRSADASDVIFSSDYDSVLAFEMYLIENGNVKNDTLDVPVTVSIPIPSGVSTNRLRILHKLSNGNTDVIIPNISGGRATFTITHFSIFAFANAADNSSSVNSGKSASGSLSKGSSNSALNSISRASKSSGSSSDSSGSSSSISSKKGETITAGKGASRAEYKKISKNAVRYEVTDISDKATKVVVPATVKIGGNTYKVTSIAPKAFAGKKKLKSLTIGKNVKKIGAEAVSKCPQLKTITVNTTGLIKKNVKNSLKGSSVNTIKAPKKNVDAYGKFFTKANAGKKANVKAK